MKYLFSLALLNAAVYARCSEETKRQYFGFAAMYEKDIKEVEDLEKRLTAFEKSSNKVNRMN